MFTKEKVSKVYRKKQLWRALRRSDSAFNAAVSSAAACAACHTTGVLNAPKFRDAEGWSARMSKGIDGLLATAISGLNQMPARGGVPTITDDELRAAIEHMVVQ